MESNKRYDLWSDGYGASIHLLDDKDEYPVAGYSKVLDEVYNIVRESDAKKVLDAGFGTGIVTRKLYNDGYTIYGVDASEQMVEAGRENMPDAKLVVADYSMGLPLALTNETYDMIISTYALHHLDRFEKVNLILDMLRLLPAGGKVVIGDLAFATTKEMKEFRRQNRDNWVYEESYMVYEELEKSFHNVEWKKLSKCAGVVIITK